ncbi:AraC family transcriptional regulator [Bradyrhizobium sp. UFLA03-84]|uniref:AraC family transcriptional regulator n=1 Tax=Bradyrhizobium sp. UFLA03-84 TaxID=418599 RepID=UPI0011776021|nr:AraC family transcriptional regulator [Bradyrhizobium sp. UFLA03-84]
MRLLPPNRVIPVNGMRQFADTCCDTLSFPMTSTADDVALSRFSLADFAEQDRMAAWRDLYGRLVLKADLAPLPDHSLHADVTVRMLPGLSITSASMSAFRYERGAEQLADGNDGLVLVIGSHDAMMVQRGHEVTWTAGDGLLLSSADPVAMVCPSPANILCLHVPRPALAPLVSSIDSSVMQPIARSTEALKLLVSYVGALQEDYALATPQLRHHVASHVHDLIAVALGATRDAAALADGRGVRAARLRAIKADIIDHLNHGNLTVAAVARRHGVTPRQVQRMFEGDGTSFSQFVLERRLARAHRLLVNPRYADRPVSAVAFEVGFGDVSYFNRTFRRQYGAPPSDVRESARRGLIIGHSIQNT